jgi:hypothetical protein
MPSTARHVRFEYCISLLVLTLRRESEAIVLKPSDSIFWASLPYCLITLCLGWWGVPWGVLLTPYVLWKNLSGGRVVDHPATRGGA